MKKDKGRNGCERRYLSAEETEKFYKAGVRCAVALNGRGRLMAILYFDRYASQKALSVALVNLRATNPAAVVIVE
jgi:hypothetical protein